MRFNLSDIVQIVDHDHRLFGLKGKVVGRYNVGGRHSYDVICSCFRVVLLDDQLSLVV